MPSILALMCQLAQPLGPCRKKWGICSDLLAEQWDACNLGLGAAGEGH